MTSTTATLKFHPQFKTPTAGSAILRADDDTCFYFRLALLAELSTFFRDLPPATTADTHHGTAVIPLPGLSQDGMALFLQLIGRPIVSSTDLDRHEVCYCYRSRSCCAQYEVPIVFRLLTDALQLNQSGTAFERFVVCALGDAKDPAITAASETLETNIFLLPVDQIAVLKEYCPKCWQLLKDLYLRRVLAPPLFVSQVAGMNLVVPNSRLRHICSLCKEDHNDIHRTFIEDCLKARSGEDISTVLRKAEKRTHCHRTTPVLNGSLGEALMQFKRNMSSNLFEKTLL